MKNSHRIMASTLHWCHGTGSCLEKYDKIMLKITEKLNVEKKAKIIGIMIKQCKTIAINSNNEHFILLFLIVFPSFFY